jgi:uracil-DNA glycosylase
MTYDPRLSGANCDRCWLSKHGAGGPVPPEHHGSPIIVVGDAPVEADVLEGRPFVGGGGAALDDARISLGLARQAFDYTKAIACRAPANDLKIADSKRKAANRALKAQGQPEWLDPRDACRPRLLHDLGTAPIVVAAGSTAWSSLGLTYAGNHGDVVGAGLPAELAGIARGVVAAPHPIRVAREARWRRTLALALDRAVRWTQGRVDFADRVLLSRPSLDDAVDRLRTLADQPFAVYDTETDSIEPLLASLRTIQIGPVSDAPDAWAMSIPYRNIDGSPAWPPAHAAIIAQEIYRAFVESKARWIGHNILSYDAQVMRRFFAQEVGIPAWPKFAFDTLILDRQNRPDMPHKLGNVVAFYVDASPWKEDRDTRSDEDLARYGARDVANNARVVRPIIEHTLARIREMEARTLPEARPLDPEGKSVPSLFGWSQPPASLGPIVKLDHNLAGVAVGIHEIGIRVDETKRNAWASTLRVTETLWCEGTEHEPGIRGWLRRAGNADIADDFNPRSARHIRRILYDTWDLEPPAGLPRKALYTASGDRKCDLSVLRAYEADKKLSAAQLGFLKALRMSRRAGKAAGTFLDPLIPYQTARLRWRGKPDGDLDATDDPDADDAEEVDDGRLTGNEFRLVTWEDGRARFTWNAGAATTVGRWSCGGRPSRMNGQTIPDRFRDIFVPSPGNVFVGADLAAVHLVLIANMWRIRVLLDGYLRGECPHAALATTLYGSKFTQAKGFKGKDGYTDWSGVAKSFRNRAKTFRYNAAYKGAAESLHMTLTRTEDETTGELSMKDLTLDEVRAMRQRWLAAEPEWPAAWDNEERLYKTQGFQRSAILGRRMDMPDGFDPNQVINSRILSTEADLMGAMTIEVANAIPWHAWGRNCGLLGQFHDAFLLEVPESRAKEAAGILAEVMNRKIPGWPVPITAESKIGMSWKEV